MALPDRGTRIAAGHPIRTVGGTRVEGLTMRGIAHVPLRPDAGEARAERARNPSLPDPHPLDGLVVGPVVEAPSLPGP